MGIFKKFQKRNEPKRGEETGAEEYELATFSPRKFPMTKELYRRQKEDELRKKYCGKTVKNNDTI